MTNEQFIYWLKGYMAAQIDCQIKTDIEKTLAIVGIKSTSTLMGQQNPTSRQETMEVDWGF